MKRAEVALGLRDRDPVVRVSASDRWRARSCAGMRSVASYRPDFVAGIPVPADQRGNPDWLAESIPVYLNGSAFPAVDPGSWGANMAIWMTESYSASSPAMGSAPCRSCVVCA